MEATPTLADAELDALIGRIVQRAHLMEAGRTDELPELLWGVQADSQRATALAVDRLKRLGRITQAGAARLLGVSEASMSRDLRRGRLIRTR